MNPDLPERVRLNIAVTELAEIVERTIHSTVNSFDLGGARLYGVQFVSGPSALEGDARASVCRVAEHPDVYRLLSLPSSALARMFQAAALVTTGWAAPLSTDGEVDGPPSEHALRRRVRLVVIVCDEGVASVVRFADDPDDTITDPGSATGALAEAISQFWYERPRHFDAPVADLPNGS
jgi:hypothetical protein